MKAANKCMPHCYFCGSTLIQDDSQMCADVNVDYEGDEEAMVHYSHCPKCGRSYEIVDRQRMSARIITANTGTKTAKIWQTIIKEGQQPRAFLGNSAARR